MPESLYTTARPKLQYPYTTHDVRLYTDQHRRVEQHAIIRKYFVVMQTCIKIMHRGSHIQSSTNKTFSAHEHVCASWMKNMFPACTNTKGSRLSFF